MKSICIVVCLATLVANAPRSFSEPGVHSSELAVLNSGERPLVSTISFPEFAGDLRVVIRCSAAITVSGRVLQNVCVDAIGPDADRLRGRLSKKLVSSVDEAVLALRIEPAIVNGEPRRVWMNYAVEFSQRGESKAIKVYEYFPISYDDLDESVFGPQRVLLRRSVWDAGCVGRGDKFWVLAELDAEGEHGAIQVTPKSTSRRCRNTLRQEIVRSQFLPALAEGRPIPSVYVEYFGYTDW